MENISVETKIVRYSAGDELPENIQLLVNKAKEQTQKAYAPYSQFYVGVALLLENGEIVLGSNQENAAYPSGICAERTAVFYANSKFPDVPVEAIAIAAYTNGKFLDEPITPCGACRQVLLETENRYKKGMLVVLYGEKSIYVIENATQLLPLSFTERSLQT